MFKSFISHTPEARAFTDEAWRSIGAMYYRYLAEFDFRYNARGALGIDDENRAERALAGIKGKRLKYRDSLAASVASQSPDE